MCLFLHLSTQSQRMQRPQRGGGWSFSKRLPHSTHALLLTHITQYIKHEPLYFMFVHPQRAQSNSESRKAHTNKQSSQLKMIYCQWTRHISHGEACIVVSASQSRWLWHTDRRVPLQRWNVSLTAWLKKKLSILNDPCSSLVGVCFSSSWFYSYHHFVCVCVCVCVFAPTPHCLGIRPCLKPAGRSNRRTLICSGCQ